ncbi:MAG: type III polyketide synthase [Sphingomonadaceae bacterium]|nr:type III polyketide synthase [Sphingomonadaceae bacterium]
MTTAHINAIATATPPHDVHTSYLELMDEFIVDRRDKLIFKRMAGRAGIEHRYSYFLPIVTERGTEDSGAFYVRGSYPSTGRRMRFYEERAPGLAISAVEQLDFDRETITHLVVASCTGFVAPGIDQLLVRALGLRPNVERTVVGFMGCYAAVNALRLAHHFVRSEPAAKVLVVNLELCTLHLQETQDIEQLLAMMLFGDGCTAALVSAEETGLRIADFRAATLPQSNELITWRIGDQGFDMRLSGEVPKRIQAALEMDAARNDDEGLLRGRRPDEYDGWAVHAGGRSILDAVETGFGLSATALDRSRGVLRDFGNMSSATLMFVLSRILGEAERVRDGLAMAFGPGLAAETFRFRHA